MTYKQEDPGKPQTEDTNNSIDSAIAEFKKNIGISPNSKIKIVSRSEQPDNTTKVTLSYSGEHPIKTQIDDILVSTPLTAEIHFDKNGKLLNHKNFDPDPNIINSLKEEINNMLKEKQIQLPRSNNAIPESSSKEFYIEKDKEGRQHLKRSRISSN